MVKTDDEKYEIVKQAFIAHTKSFEGPHCITITTIESLYRLNHLYDTGEVLLKIHPLFQRLVNDLCPYQVILPNSAFDIVKLIENYDANTEYIYAFGMNILNHKTRILRVSNEGTAIIVRMII